MKIYIVMGYTSIFDGDEVKAVFFDESKAKSYAEKFRYYQPPEEYEIQDAPLTNHSSRRDNDCPFCGLPYNKQMVCPWCNKEFSISRC